MSNVVTQAELNTLVRRIMFTTKFHKLANLPELQKTYNNLQTILAKHPENITSIDDSDLKAATLAVHACLDGIKMPHLNEAAMAQETLDSLMPAGFKG